MGISRRAFLQTVMVGLPAGVSLLHTNTASAQPWVTAPPAAPPWDSGVGTNLTRIPATSLMAPDYLRRSTYIPYLHTRFKFYGKNVPASGMAVRLIEVNYIPFAPKAKWLETFTPEGESTGEVISDTDSFALVFLDPLRKPPVEQRIYNIRHASLGKFSLLVVPLGPGKKGNYYEAVINRSNL
jgi:hypothetical protein